MTKKIIGRKFEFYSAFQVEKTNALNKNCNFFEIWKVSSSHFLTTVDAKFISSNNCMQVQVIQEVPLLLQDQEKVPNCHPQLLKTAETPA